MPRRPDLKRVLVLGAGPIVIGQACEFDYSGSQACKALRSEGLEVVLVNSNPATIMTDPELADRTYVEPLTPEIVEAIIAKERPDALLPTVGGQTALNLAMALAKIGRARTLRRRAHRRVGHGDRRRRGPAEVPRRDGRDRHRRARAAGTRKSVDEALEFVKTTGFPSIIRPSFTLGGVGGGIAYNVEEFHELVRRGLAMSPVHEVLIEESLIGWKEYELEVMRDVADNFVVICSIENIDPMGVHTGDSITVAPGAHADRQGIPADARRGAPHHLPRRRRNRRVEHPVRRASRHRADDRHRDEPPRLAILGARLEGHRVPDREDRGQARAGLSPRRDPERHHAPHAGLVRAHHRLRRRPRSRAGTSRSSPRPTAR